MGWNPCRVSRTQQQWWRARGFQVLPPPRPIAPLELRNGRPLGRLKTLTPPSAAPGLLTLRLAAASFSPACQQQRMAHLSEARARARSIEFEPAQDANPPKSQNKLATKTLTCDTDRTKARTPKWRPAFGCSRRALLGPNKKQSVATKVYDFRFS